MGTPRRIAPRGSLPVHRAACAGILAVLATALFGCESERFKLGPEPFAAVQLEGRVTDPSGVGVEGTEVTATLHETSQCSSSILATSRGTTDLEGRFSGEPGIRIGSAFEPRDVCLEVRAEPPEARPDLTSSEARTFVVTLRRRLGDKPLDEVEVNLTLPEAGES